MADPVLIRRYPHHTRLGRHQVLDPRSLAYVHTGADAPLATADHESPCPVLDQEDLKAQGIDVRTIFPGKRLRFADALGSCVGNATVAHLAERLGMSRLGLADDPVAAEVLAIKRYSRATQCDDDLADTYPRVDSGSSGLGSARACRVDGLISTYRHAVDAIGLLSLLQHGSVIMGMPWFQAWFEPDGLGFIDHGLWRTSGIAGGHEVCVTAVERILLSAAGAPDPDGTVLRIRNSWGMSWGDHGSCRIRLGTYLVLRRQIDVIQFTP